MEVMADLTSKNSNKEVEKGVDKLASDLVTKALNIKRGNR
jgi:hypothetical protein